MVRGESEPELGVSPNDDTVELKGMELKSLGQLSLREDGKDLLPANPRGKLLVLVLRHANGAEVQRGTLISLLWGGPPSRRTRHSLCQLIYAVRRAVPGLALRTRNDSLSLDATSIGYDVERLLHAATNGLVESVAVLYTGEFLDSANLPTGVAVDHWRDSVVDQLHAEIGRAYRSSMVGAEAVANWDTARACAERLLSLDPYDELAHATRLRALAAIEGIEKAVECISAIRAEFTSASLRMRKPELVATIERLEHQLKTRVLDAATDRFRIRGRAVETADLTRAWFRASTGRSTAVHVVGPGGVGKTRLIEHFLRWSAIKGSRVLLAKGSPAESRLPYSSLTELLRSAIKPGDIEKLSEPWRSAAMTILPEYSTESVGKPAIEPRQPDEARRKTFHATVVLLEQIQDGAAPLVVFLDDAQWSDELSAWAIHFAFHRLAGSRLLLVLASRAEVDGLPEQLRLLIQTLTDGRAVEIRLGPLNQAAGLALAEEAALRVGASMERAFLTAIVDAADGLPYFIIQAVRDSTEGAHGNRDVTLAANVRATFQIGLADLSEQAVLFLQGLAVLAPRPTTSVLRGMLEFSDSSFRNLTLELRQKALIREVAACLEFTHDIVQELVLATLDHQTAARLNARAATLLVSRESTPPGILALHYMAAGNNSKAHEWALHAARAAFDAAGLNDVEFYLQLAMNRASTVDEQLTGSAALIEFLCNIEKVEEARQWLRRYPAALTRLPEESARLVSLYALIAAGDGCIDAFEKQIGYLLREAVTDRCVSQYTLIRKVLGLAHSTGYAGMTEGLIRSVLSHRRELAPSPEAAKLLAALSRVWCIYEDGPTAVMIADEAIRMAELVRDKPAQMLAFVARGTVRMLLGRLREAELDFALAEQVSLQPRLGAYLDRMQINRAVLLIETRRFSEATAALDLVIPTCNVDDQLLARANLAVASLETGDSAGLLRRILDLRRTNVQLQLKWVEVFADCMDGYLCCAAGDWEAVSRISERIEREQSTRRDAAASDSSYADVLIGRSKARVDRAAALDYLGRAAKRHARGNFLGMLRIRIEEARIVLPSNYSTAKRMIGSILRNCERAGATTLARSAREVI